MIRKILDDKKGRVTKAIILLSLIVLVVLIPLGINAAGNSSTPDKKNVSEQQATSNQNTDTVPTAENSTSQTSQDQQESPATTQTQETTQNTTAETNSEENNTAINQPEQANSSSVDNTTEVQTQAEENQTIIQEANNANSSNQTESVNSSISNSSGSSGENSVSSPSTTTSTGQTIQTPGEENNLLDVQINYPQKITRGTLLKINATITNTGNAKIDSILLNWEIPSGFTIDSGQQSEIISLDSGETYTTKISLETVPSTSLGVNEIKLGVAY